MTLDEFARRALSVPFADHGRDYEAWDCYGLILCAFRDVHGVTLPAFEMGYATAGETRQDREAIAGLIDSGRPFWRPVAAPAASDVALLNIGGRPVHVGLMLDTRRMLHAEKKIGTAVERVTAPMWRDRIEGFYRYAG